MKIADARRLGSADPPLNLFCMTEQQKRGRGAVEMGPTSAAVAANVRRVRERRALSTYQLSGMLAKVGRPIAPSAISKLERGERQVTVDDLTALAVVLGVSPAMLLIESTHLPTDTVEVTGGGTVPAFAAWHWAKADVPRLRYDTDRRRETQDMESMLYGMPVWMHPKKPLPDDVVKALGLADNETLWLGWDDEGSPVMGKERDDG